MCTPLLRRSVHVSAKSALHHPLFVCTCAAGTTAPLGPDCSSGQRPQSCPKAPIHSSSSTSRSLSTFSKPRLPSSSPITRRTSTSRASGQRVVSTCSLRCSTPTDSCLWSSCACSRLMGTRRLARFQSARGAPACTTSLRSAGLLRRGHAVLHARERASPVVRVEWPPQRCAISARCSPLASRISTALMPYPRSGCAHTHWCALWQSTTKRMDASRMPGCASGWVPRRATTLSRRVPRGRSSRPRSARRRLRRTGANLRLPRGGVSGRPSEATHAYA